MNKTDAAKYLECGLDNVQRLMKEGKIAFTYIKGKYGKEVDITQEELDRYKTEKESGVALLSVPVVAKSPDSTNLSTLSSPNIQGVNMVDFTSSILRVFERVATGLEKLDKQNQSALLGVKLSLSLQDAATLSGYSKGFLLTAIKKDELKAAKRGKGWNIKRTDLEEWVKVL